MRDLQQPNFPQVFYLSQLCNHKIPIFWAFFQVKRLGMLNIDVNHLGKPVIF
jgi:hypothetical protein